MENPDEGTLAAPGEGARDDLNDIDELDADALRSELRLARERLALHDGFDRVIAENVRRSREMLDAASDLRANAAAGIAADDRNRIAAEIAGLQRMAATMSTALSELVDRITALSHPLASPFASLPGDIAPVDVDDLSRPAAPETCDALDLIVHGVPDAVHALSLQRAIRAQDGVEDVTLREFAEGILRLRTTVSAEVDLATLADQDSALDLEILHRARGVIECAVKPDTATISP